MKTIIIGLAALCAQGLPVHAVPHVPHAALHGARVAGNHKALHQKRDVSTAVEIVTDVVTVTDYSAVVWVDPKGNVLSTQHGTPATATVSSVASTSVTVQPTTTTTPPPVPAAASSTNPVVQVSSIVPSLVDGSRVASDMMASSIPASLPQASAANVNKAGNTQSQASTISGFNVDYDTIGDNDQCRTTSDADFQFFKSQGINMIRIYDIPCDLGVYVNAASAHGLKLMVGLNGITNLNNDLNNLSNMITATGPSWSVIDTVYIGNELVNTGQADAGTVAGAVTTARSLLQTRGFTANVITVDTFSQIESNSIICSTSSYCGANTHPFFDPNTVASDAGTYVRNALNAMSARNPGKRIVITETGWPYNGNSNGQAVPSIQNQQVAMDAISREFAGQQAGDIFFFQAFDAGYKDPGSLGVERYFGIYGH